MSDVSSIIIQELAGSKRTLTLNGPALPFQGASWKTKQSLSTTWYPGNGREATQHVLGPQELPSSWEGVWRRTQLGRTPSTLDDGGSITHIVNPTDLRDLLDEIFRAGTPLRVTWITVAADNTRGSVSRVGRAADWEFPHERLHDIQWKITFEWSGRGDVTQKVVATRDGDANAATVALMAAIENATTVAAKLDTPLALKKGIAVPATHFNLGQLEALTKAPNTMLKEFTRSVQAVTTQIAQVGQLASNVKSLPFQLANTALASARNSMAVSHEFIDRVTGTPIELYTTQYELRDITRSAKAYGACVDAAYLVARQARTYEAQTRPVSSTNMGGAHPSKTKNTGTRPATVVSVHVVKPHETLMMISKTYYKSPDHAVDIAKANHLPWHTVNVDPGTVLLIPVLNSNTSL